MAFFPPIPLIRRNVIVNSLRDCGATSEATTRTLAEAGVINPNGFKRITDRLVKKGEIHRTPDGRYYV
jgi:predicted transcriptional regulator of viral defense system